MRLHKNIRINALTISFEQMHPHTDGLKNKATALVPALYAATGNNSMAVSSLALQANNLPIMAKGWQIEIKASEATFTGWVTGIFFKEGDMVDLICNDHHIIYAIYSPARAFITIRPGIVHGIKFEIQNCLKVFKWISIVLTTLMVLILLIINLSASGPFSDFLLQLPVILIGTPCFSALLVWASSRKELKSAWLGSKIFSILQFKEPGTLVLATKNRLQKMETGSTGYYFKTNGLDKAAEVDKY